MTTALVPFSSYLAAIKRVEDANPDLPNLAPVSEAQRQEWKGLIHRLNGEHWDGPTPQNAGEVETFISAARELLAP